MKSVLRIVLSVFVMLLCVGSYAQEFDSLQVIKSVEDSSAFWQERTVIDLENGGQLITVGPEMDTLAYRELLVSHAEFLAEEIKNSYLAIENQKKLKRQYKEVDNMLRDLTGDRFLVIKTEENISMHNVSNVTLKWPDGTSKKFKPAGKKGRVNSTTDSDYFRVQYYGPGYVKLGTGIFASKNREFVSKGEVITKRGKIRQRFVDVDDLGFVLTITR